MNIQELENKRIAVLLSGGVDSSVVVYELVRQGFQPDCFYIKIGPEETEEWDCCGGPQVRVQLGGGGLPQGILGSGDALHDG